MLFIHPEYTENRDRFQIMIQDLNGDLTILTDGTWSTAVLCHPYFISLEMWSCTSMTILTDAAWSTAVLFHHYFVLLEMWSCTSRSTRICLNILT